MKQITVSFSLPNGYQNQFVTLNQNTHTLNFTLHQGTNTAESDFVDLGILHRFEGRRLLGKFSFQYSYDTERRAVTVCGTDFDSAHSMCLTTFPEGTTEYCHQRAAGGGFEEDDLRANPHWNYVSPLTPGLKDLFSGVVRTVNNQLIETLQKEPQMVVQVRKPLPELSAEEHLQFLTVYRRGEFLGSYDANRAYGPEDTVVHVESVFGGEVTMNYAENFANVIGSTPDPKIAGLTWIQLWARQFGSYPTICTSYNYGGFACGPSLVGGHVILGQHAAVVPAGSNSVFIFPICVQHNNNDNVFMAALQYLKGIWLNNYLGS